MYGYQRFPFRNLIMALNFIITLLVTFVTQQLFKKCKFLHAGHGLCYCALVEVRCMLGHDITGGGGGSNNKKDKGHLAIFPAA